MADDAADPILAKALQEIEELQAFVKKYREMKGKAGTTDTSAATGEQAKPGAPGISPFGDVLDPLAAVYPGIFTGKSQPKAVRALLERVKRPLRTKVIVDCLAKGGLEPGGKKPVVNLWGILDRSDDFVLVKKAGWALAEWYDERTLAKMREAKKETETTETKEPEEENGKDEAVSG